MLKGVIFLDRNTSTNNYIVVFPNGEVKGVEDQNDAHITVLGYYEGKVNELNNDREASYEDYSTNPLESTINICISLGAYEGDCTIYDLEDLISKIQDSGIFDEEKQEIITKLMQPNIYLNVYDYQIDDILKDVIVIPHR